MLSLLTAILSFAYFIWQGKGALTIVDDFNTQQLTFAAAVQNVLCSDDPGQWVWNLDLGASLITGFSFYNLGSPFYWVSLLFPKGSFPYLAGWLYIAKYVVASITAYIYLHGLLEDQGRHGEDCAIVGALLYAFSGFQSTNLMFYHFHDAVAFFPLLLWGIENIDNRRKRPAFIAAIWINCLVNYFFFIQEVVFMILYFVIRNWGGRTLRVFLQRMVACLLCGVLGVGMAAVLFVPSILYIMGSDRSSTSVHLGDLIYHLREALFILKGMLMPADIMRDHSALYEGKWDSTSCYIPLFGMSYVFAYIRKARTWVWRLLCVLLVISFSPLVQSAFLLFTVVYQRWWYMLVLILALATMKVLERPQEYAVSKGIYAYVGMLTVFYLALMVVTMGDGERAVRYPDRFTYYYLVAAAGPILLEVLRRTHRLRMRAVIPLVMVCCVVTTMMTMHYYRLGTDSKAYMENYKACSELEPINEQYRYASTDNVQTLTGNAAGVGAFTSTMEMSSMWQFAGLFDHSMSNATYNRWSIPGLISLLGGRYSVTEDADAENIVAQTSGEGKTLYVTEGSAFPIGFALDGYIYTEELRSLPAEQRAYALMQAVVIEPEDEDAVDAVMQHIDLAEIDVEPDVDALIAKAERNAVLDFDRSTHGFTCTTSYDRDRVVYYTVPNDAGWTATIDGAETEIVDSGGMMLFVVPAGEHQVAFRYDTPGLNAGVVISVVSWVVFAGIILVMWQKRDTIVRSIETA